MRRTRPTRRRRRGERCRPSAPPSGFAGVIAGFERDGGCIRIEAHADRIAAGSECIELVLQHAADHHDAAVAPPEMLLRMGGDGALPDLRLVVAGMTLVLLLAHLPPELAVELRAHAAKIA